MQYMSTEYMAIQARIAIYLDKKKAWSALAQGHRWGVFMKSMCHRAEIIYGPLRSNNLNHQDNNLLLQNN